MKRIKYSKKIDSLLRQGVSLRSIRKKMKLDKKGQLFKVRNITVGFISAVVSITIFLFANPILKDIIDSVTGTVTNPLARFLIILMPYFILVILFLILITAFRGETV